ncbi:MAG TPA: outer membrane beta-barrel protein [Puia sp.]|jgi:hypothetical protein
MRKASPLSIFPLLIILIPHHVFSQGSVKGSLVDSVSHKPLTLATLTVFKQSDTTMVAFRLSDPTGHFRIPGIPLHTPCYMVVSFIGYKVARKEIELKDNTPLDLGTIPLPTSAKSLDEALVTAERPPIRVYKDTIEFNASSFKTLPDALVEDLLRKLPGVDVDRAGNIRVNGKAVNRILVDGKYFFGDDPKMATRNLPANAIDKVQVIDDKEQIDRSTDGDMTQIGKVINLTLKKSIKKGWFGKAYAGGGTDDRYQAGGIANIYRDTVQLSLLAFSNNINAGGFNVQDITSMGGFNRSGINSMNIKSTAGSQGFGLNGISFGGGDLGENRATGAGFNLNHTPTKKLSLYTQYFFGYNDNTLVTDNQDQQFINDTSIISRTLTHTKKDLTSHVGNIGLTYRPDNLTLLTFRASGNYSVTSSDAGTLLNTTNSKLGTVNNGDGNLLTSQYTGAYSHDLRYTRKSKRHPGRILNLSQVLQYQHDLQRNTTLSDNIYFYPASDTLLFDQLRRTQTPNLSTTTAIGWADPLSARWTLRLNANYQYLEDQYGIGIYNNDPVTGHYDLFLPEGSNGYHRTQNIGFANALLAYTIKSWTITGGVALSSQQINNTYDKVDKAAGLSLFNVFPSLAITWKNVRAQYNESVTAPEITYLSPVPDSTNPFYVVYGNPLLKPGHRRSFSISWFSSNPRNNLRENLSVNGSRTDRDVILSRTVATDGSQSITPVNADGTLRLSSLGSLGRDFRDRHFIFSARINARFLVTRQELLVNDNAGTSATTSVGPGLSLGFNWNDKVEINPDYSYSISASHYSIPAFRSIRVNTHQVQADVIVRAPGKWIWENKIFYRYNDQVAPGLPRDNLLWNAALAYPFLAHNKGQLKLNVYDVLNRSNNFIAYTSGNAIINQDTNVLQRYLMLTFTYNIQNFNTPDKEKEGKQRLFVF